MINLIITSAQGAPPVYNQIYDQIVAQIVRGNLSADEILPSVRKVAGELKISVITVRNAYDKLERENFIYSVPAKGYFVKGHGNVKKVSEEHALEKLRSDLPYYKNLGLSLEEFVNLVKKLY